jgi:PAS domain S-box-containing protein
VGLDVLVCHDLIELIGKLDEGAGVAVIAEEAFRSHLDKLVTWVSQQPSWSDFPFVILTSRGANAQEDIQRLQLLNPLGNVSLMERPLSAVSLTSAVTSGLRARRRQYQTQAMLDDLQAGEERLRLFIEHAPAALVMLDRDMRYLAVSKRWLTDFHIRGDILGRIHYEVFPEIPAAWREGHQRCLEGAAESFAADRLVRADGTSIWLKREVRPWRDNRGQIGGLVVAWEDITASKQAEERQRVLTREVLHRTKNLLAVIQSIAAGTFRGTNDPAQHAFISRLHALSTAHSLLTDSAGMGATLEDVARGQMASFAGSVTIEGPTLFLKPNAAQSFALMIHELATNAAKHGALSVATGSVSMRWCIHRNSDVPKLVFVWQERGGPTVKQPLRQGFGTVLLQHAVYGLDSAPVIDFAPGGVTYRIEAAVSLLVPTSEARQPQAQEVSAH